MRILVVLRAADRTPVAQAGREYDVSPQGPTANRKVLGRASTHALDCRDFLHKSSPTLIAED